MPDTFAAEERTYRRGLVLGLTMAEIMILVLFALLLIWMTGLRERDRLLRRAAVATQQANEATATIDQLRQEIEQLVGSPDRSNAFDEQFRELVVAKDKISELQAEIASLQESSRILTEIAEKTGTGDKKATIAAIEQKLRVADRLLNNMQKQKSTEPMGEHELAVEAASLLTLQEELKKSGQTATQVIKVIEVSKRKAEDSDAQVKTLQGRLENFRQKLAALGKGTEKPACWADPVTGKPEYIFDIGLQSGTIRVHDNVLPNRTRDQAKLPLGALQFEKPLGFNDFRLATHALFQWSEQEGCRFFVRVTDETAAHEKAKYKLVLRTVQEHFYTFEDFNTAQ